MTPIADYDLLLRSIRVARELEKGGFYNQYLRQLSGDTVELANANTA